MKMIFKKRRVFGFWKSVSKRRFPVHISKIWIRVQKTLRCDLYPVATECSLLLQQVLHISRMKTKPFDSSFSCDRVFPGLFSINWGGCSNAVPLYKQMNWTWIMTSTQEWSKSILIGLRRLQAFYYSFFLLFFHVPHLWHPYNITTIRLVINSDTHRSLFLLSPLRYAWWSNPHKSLERLWRDEPVPSLWRFIHENKSRAHFA